MWWLKPCHYSHLLPTKAKTNRVSSRSLAHSKWFIDQSYFSSLLNNRRTRVVLSLFSHSLPFHQTPRTIRWKDSNSELSFGKVIFGIEQSDIFSSRTKTNHGHGVASPKPAKPMHNAENARILKRSVGHWNGSCCNNIVSRRVYADVGVGNG